MDTKPFIEKKNEKAYEAIQRLERTIDYFFSKYQEVFEEYEECVKSDFLHYSGPVTTFEIEAAEKKMGFALPKTYKNYISKYGHTEFQGAKDNWFDGQLSRYIVLSPGKITPLITFLTSDIFEEAERYEIGEILAGKTEDEKTKILQKLNERY